jgi:NAD(P)-dependent dehydrogenase (short-subunit alcohol dehydrogenase family)
LPSIEARSCPGPRTRWKRNGPRVIYFRLDGHRVLVAGAGRGLGKAVADGLVQLGATVYGISRDPAVAREIAVRNGTPPRVLDYVVRLQEMSGGVDIS